MSLRVIDLSKSFYKGARRNITSALLDQVTGKQREKFWALRDINFEVMPGEAYGVIGPNGAGKSTLLKLLSGIMPPTTGRIDVHGRLSTLIEVGAGFHPDLTGRENVFLNGTVLGMSRQEIRRKFDEIVAFSEIEKFIDTPVKRYSSGMLARLGFSVAAHVEPEVLLVDEVLSVGDYVFQRKSAAKMRSVMANGTTVVFVSHDLQAVESICQRCLLLEKGHAIREGDTPDVVDEYVDRYAPAELTNNSIKRRISIASIQNSEGQECNRFRSGESAIVTIGYSSAANPVCVLTASDEFRFEAFAIELPRPVASKNRISLRLHLAPGAYQLSVQEKNGGPLDTRSSERTIYISSQLDFRGVANLYPQFEASIVSQEQGNGSPSEH